MNTSKSDRAITFYVDEWDSSDPLPSPISQSAYNSEHGTLRELEYLIDDQLIQLTPDGDAFLLTVVLPTGTPHHYYAGKRLPSRCDYWIRLEHVTLRLHDTGPDITESHEPDLPLADFGQFTPENVAMIVSLIGAAIGVTTVVLKGIEAWLSQKASRKLRIRYKDFEVEISGTLSEEDIRRRIAIFDHLSETLDRRKIEIEKVAE